MTPELRDAVLGILDKHRIMTLATNRPDGWPQATVVGYANDGLKIYCFVSRLSSSMPNLRGRLLVLLSQRLLGMQDHLVMLGRKTAKERVASFLLHIAERSDAEEDVPFELPMSRQDVADYLGLTIETVCRMLTELKRERIIAIPSLSQVVVNDMDALQALSEAGE